MPTPPLPLFRALLDSLQIPINPPNLSSIPPSLLLLTLETLLGYRLPLSKTLRLCETQADEVGVIKCLLGVLGDDELGMDLGIIDPLGVVHGDEMMIGAVIMGLAVVAKRRGIAIKPITEEVEDVMDEEGWDHGQEDSESSLPNPLVPDISLTSPVLQHKPDPRSIWEKDVFGKEGTRGNTSLFEGRRAARSPSPEHLAQQTDGFPSNAYITPLPLRAKLDFTDLIRQDLDQDQQAHPAERREEVTFDYSLEHDTPFVRHSPHDYKSRQMEHWSTSDIASSSSSKTVLQDMLDEFGLGLGS